MSSNKDNTFNIIVVGKVKDFDGIKSECEYNVPCKPNDTVKIFISNFFKISGLDPFSYKLYKNQEILEKYDQGREQGFLGHKEFKENMTRIGKRVPWS